jgi:hypothetical protein
MSTSRYATLVGLALGAIFALTENFGWTFLAALFAAVGYLVGLVLEGRIDIDTGSLTGGRRDRTTTGSSTRSV